MRQKTLANALGMSGQSLAMLKNRKAQGIRFATLDKICQLLQCRPENIIHYSFDESLLLLNACVCNE